MRTNRRAEDAATTPHINAFYTVSQSCVQQPCSNPDKEPENSGKAVRKKSGYLQYFCKPRKSPANHRTDFAWQR
ncbi:MAG TPA: hypothetical protein VHK27_06485, partial [Gammaproteobacteria bacterium]|nr:hypothetical protein [Gammaproteobacteria bacterium]